MNDSFTLASGRYRVLAVLGRSTFATVYEAHDTKTGDRVAVKVLSVGGTHGEIITSMFRKEVDALEGFDHPGVVRLIDHFQEPDGNTLGIVLELVPGGKTLHQLIEAVAAKSEPRRSVRWRLEQLARLLSVLDAAHRRNVIHRDVKPANVLVDRDLDELRLADFGIARLLEHYGRGGEGVTLRDFYSRPYAAPEQVLRGDASFAADLHAFGLMSAALLAWTLPAQDFKPEKLPTLLEPLRAELRDPTVYGKLLALLGELLRTEPTLRPRVPTIARTLAEALERAGERAGVPIRITTSARTKARASGCASEAALLADLNDGLRARYETSTDRRTGAETYLVKCFGKGLWGMLKPDELTPEQLVLVDLGRNPPAMHARQREAAVSAPFNLSAGTGSAEPLVSFLFHEHEASRRREDEKRRKNSLLEVAKFILARERERLLRLKITYQVVQDEGRTAFGAKLAAAVGARTDDQHDARGDYLKVKVVHVAPWDDSTVAPDDLEDTWDEPLDRGTPFILDGERFATFHAYDPASRILSLRLRSPRKVPREGVLECKDVALDAALKRQESAIDHFVEDAAVNPQLGRLLLYPEENRIGDMDPLELFQPLEPAVEMQSLIERAHAARDFFFVQGPPGTGKTTLITELMAQILTHDPKARVLLTSQANEAVNNALDALRILAKARGASWRLLRDVPPRRADRDAAIGFEAVFAEWASATRERSAKALAAFASAAPPKLEAVRTALARWSDRLEHAADVRQDYAESVQVFGVTCLRVPTLWKMLREVRFDWVIVDEAAKATPAEVLVSLVVGRRFILVGDHRQLPPFLDRETELDVEAAGLDVARARRSLFEELFDKVPEPNRHVLRRQFRMQRSIGDFVGRLFYPDVGLETGVADADRTIELRRFDRPHRVFWVDVAGNETPDRTSWWNQQEIDVVVRLLKEMEKELFEKKQSYTVGVIAAYAAQAARLERAIIPNARSWKAVKVRVDTVDAFQGKQDDVILYSLVRVGEGEKRFLSDRRRLNVAFSRAKRLLVIVGHRKTAEQSPRLNAAVQLIPDNNFIEPGAIP